MTRSRALVTLLLGALVAAPPTFAQERDAGTGAAAARAITSYNHEHTMRVTGAFDVAAGSTIQGDVAVLNGPVTISGKVTGALVAINADVRLAAGAGIGGNLTVIGGTITGLDGAVVSGEVMRRAELLRYHLTDGTMVAEDEPTFDDAWWKRKPRLRTTRRNDRSWSDLTFTSAHTYNRVEGLPLLIGPRVHQLTPWGRFAIDALGVVRTAGPMRWDRETLGHDVTGEIQLGRPLGVGIGGRLFDIVDGVEDWQMSDGEVGLAAFILHRDFRDYYRRHGAQGFVKFHAGLDADLTFSFGDERWQRARARDPLSIFHPRDDWRANPRTDEGRMHLATARIRVDTRRRESSTWGGWFLNAEWEHGAGVLARDPGMLTVMPFPEDVHYTRGFVDARRYNRLAPDVSLNVRLAAGGWLSGDRLPMERRLSVGGPATLPGYDFRNSWRVDPDVLNCNGTALLGAPALCDRMMLLQAEFRGDFRIGWVRNDARDDWWRPGFNRRASWVVFTDAGRGWQVGASNGSTTYSNRALPAFSSFRSDIGAGIDFGSIGVYVAKATTTAREPVNVFFRIQHRF